MAFAISEQTRDQLVDLLTQLGNDPETIVAGYGALAANILPHLKGAPDVHPDDVQGTLTDAPKARGSGRPPVDVSPGALRSFPQVEVVGLHDWDRN
jgi:hypothetical protein